MTELVFRMPDNIENEHHVNLSALFVSHKQYIKDRTNNRYALGVEHKLYFHNDEAGNDFFRAMLDKGIKIGGYVKEKPVVYEEKESAIRRTIRSMKIKGIEYLRDKARARQH